MLDQRGRLLGTALGFVTLRGALHHPALATLHGWLDSWRGVGAIVAWMHRQGYDVQLTQYDERGWRATFYVAGMGAQRDERDGVRVGADAVASGAAGGVGRHAARDREPP